MWDFPFNKYSIIWGEPSVVQLLAIAPFLQNFKLLLQSSKLSLIFFSRVVMAFLVIGIWFIIIRSTYTTTLHFGHDLNSSWRCFSSMGSLFTGQLQRLFIKHSRSRRPCRQLQVLMLINHTKNPMKYNWSRTGWVSNEWGIPWVPNTNKSQVP
jgi:hypothetical protein